MKVKPDSDLYPPYSGDYYNDMQQWKTQTSCNHPDCDCAKFIVKGTCKYEKGAVTDMGKKHPNVQF